MVAETPQSFQSVDQPNAELIFGSTPGMREVRMKLEGALRDDLPVLIEGESGTGKEVVGRFLHWHSEREKGPFVKVNCGALQFRQSESEIFRGGTGTAEGSRPKEIAIDLASRGTLFLDEIGDLGAVVQQQLVGIFGAGGCGRPDGRDLDPRFVCASSLNSGSKASENPILAELLGSFQHRVRLLPLRERKRDLPQLCEYLAEKFARSFNRPVPKLSQSVLELFAEWSWPGNIRELENWVARIVVLGTEEAMATEYCHQREGKTEGSRRHRATRVNSSFSRRTRKYR